jgi:heme exporter protein C
VSIADGHAAFYVGDHERRRFHTGRSWTDIANPTRFVALADRIMPWLAGLAALALAAGVYISFAAPEDYQQGITVRIMYIHVPFAWLSMMCYSIMAVAALGTLVWRHPLADVSLKAAAPIGAVFTALALSPARSGASRCGAPGGSGTRG